MTIRLIDYQKNDLLQPYLKSMLLDHYLILIVMPLIYFMVWMYRWISFIIFQKNTSMALSTTIIRASPTPPVEPFDNGNVFSSSKSPEPLCHSEIPGPNKKTSELGSRSQSDFCKDYENEYSKGNRQSEPGPRLYTQRDSGYSNKVNIQHPSGTASEQARQVLPHVLGSGSCFGAADDMTYGSVPSYTSQGALTNLPNPLTGCSLFSSQMAQQYLSSEGLYMLLPIRWRAIWFVWSIGCKTHLWDICMYLGIQVFSLVTRTPVNNIHLSIQSARPMDSQVLGHGLHEIL